MTICMSKSQFICNLVFANFWTTIFLQFYCKMIVSLRVYTAQWQFICIFCLLHIGAIPNDICFAIYLLVAYGMNSGWHYFGNLHLGDFSIANPNDNLLRRPAAYSHVKCKSGRIRPQTMHFAWHATMCTATQVLTPGSKAVSKPMGFQEEQESNHSYSLGGDGRLPKD